MKRDWDKSGYLQRKTCKIKKLATIHSDTQHEYYLQVPPVAILESSSARVVSLSAGRGPLGVESGAGEGDPGNWGAPRVRIVVASI
jgi:hypothetical protein